MKEEKLLFDVGPLMQMGRNDLIFLKKMLHIYTNTMPQALIQMKEAYDQKNWMMLGKTAHRIKSSFSGLAINSVAQDIKSLESLSKNATLPEQEIKETLNRVAQVILRSIDQIKLAYPEFY